MLSSIGLILFSVSFVLAQVLVKGTVKDNLGEGDKAWSVKTLCIIMQTFPPAEIVDT